MCNAHGDGSMCVKIFPNKNRSSMISPQNLYRFPTLVVWHICDEFEGDDLPVVAHAVEYWDQPLRNQHRRIGTCI